MHLQAHRPDESSAESFKPLKRKSLIFFILPNLLS